MAPHNSTMMHSDNHKTQGIRKLRKPVIEKMRRDRINSSIEQLRMLLEKEFVKQQLPSRPEKADILEMTVSFLQRHMATKFAPSSNQTYREGHSRCLQDSLHFLSLQKQTEVQVKLLQNIHGSQSMTEGPCPSISPCYQIPNKPTCPETTQTIWRPW
ncbi:transcription factor HES-5-like [Rhinophrynus dorsalis]